MPPAFNDSTSAPGPSRPWNSATTGRARRARHAAVVTVDRRSDALREIRGELDAPLGEVREDQYLLAGREHRVDDLFEPGELARPPGEWPVVVLVRGGVVADLFEGGDRREDLALRWFRRRLDARRRSTSASSTAWYSPICSGVIAQWSSSSIWSGSSAAIAGSAFVRRNTRMPLRARIACSASTRVASPSSRAGR